MYRNQVFTCQTLSDIKMSFTLNHCTLKYFRLALYTILYFKNKNMIYGTGSAVQA